MARTLPGRELAPAAPVDGRPSPARFDDEGLEAMLDCWAQYNLGSLSTSSQSIHIDLLDLPGDRSVGSENFATET